MREIANKQESGAQSIRNFYIDGPTWTNSNKPSANKPNISNSTATTQEELARYVACVFAPTDVVEVRRLDIHQVVYEETATAYTPFPS